MHVKDYTYFSITLYCLFSFDFYDTNAKLPLQDFCPDSDVKNDITMKVVKQFK